MNELIDYDRIEHVSIRGLPFMRHPFYCGFAESDPQLLERIRARVEYFRAKARAALMRGHIKSYVFMHERPYRIVALAMCRDHVTTKRKAWLSAARDVWVDCEAPHVNLDLWRTIFHAPNAARYMMTKAEASAHAALPERVTVHRGVQRPHIRAPQGLSWTLDEAVARWFAQRYGGAGHVITRTVPRAKVLCLFKERDEHEVIVDFQRPSR